MAPENCMVALHYNIKLRKCSSLQKKKKKLNLHDPIKSLCKKIKLNACECAFTVPFYVLFSEYQWYVFNSSVFATYTLVKRDVNIFD